MKLTKKLKSNKGFTLVELVVVIAVLAILAGVGSVAYSGYIKKANEAADVSLLAAVKTAADAAAAADPAHFAVTEITVTVDGTNGSITGITAKDEARHSVTWTKDGKTEFNTFLENVNLTLDKDGTFKSGATWKSDGKGWRATTAPAAP